MDLEKVIGLLRVGNDSHAIKGHRPRKENPRLVVTMQVSDVLWQITGLHAGERQDAEADDVDHLDWYVFEDQLRAQRGLLPVPTVSPGGGGIAPTYPWGTEGAGKPRIQPGNPMVRFPVTATEMRMGHVKFIGSAAVGVELHIDRELAPYPNPSGMA
jgi:hypothetical protein